MSDFSKETSRSASSIYFRWNKKRKLFFKHNLFSPLVDQRINIKDDHLEDIFILWPETVFKFSSSKTQIASNYSYLWFKVKMLNEKPKQSGFSLRELQKYANALKSRKTFTKWFLYHCNQLWQSFCKLLVKNLLRFPPLLSVERNAKLIFIWILGTALQKAQLREIQLSQKCFRAFGYLFSTIAMQQHTRPCLSWSTKQKHLDPNNET